MTHSHINKTDRAVLETEWQVFDRIVGVDHPYRRLNEIVDFGECFRKPYNILDFLFSHSGSAI